MNSMNNTNVQQTLEFVTERVKKLKWEDVAGKTFKYIAAGFFVVYLAVLFYVISTDKDALDKNYLLYMFALIVPMAFMAMVMVSNAKSTNVVWMAIFCLVIMLIFFLVTYVPDVSEFFNAVYKSLFDFYKIEGVSEESSFLIALIFRFLLFSIVVVTLSLVYNLFLNQSYRQTGVLGFILYFIFFIPCLFMDFLRFMFEDLKNTPTMVYVLLTLEVAFLLAYFLLPAQLNKHTYAKGKQILKQPWFLGGEYTTIAGSEVLNKDDDEKDRLLNTHVVKSIENTGVKWTNRNYAISLWLSYNPMNRDLASMEGDTRDIPLFRYGTSSEEKRNDDQQAGIPYIAYRYDDKFVFKFTNGKLESNMSDEEKHHLIVDMSLPAQKWNNIVFNYHNSKVDLFINGDLERTVSLNGVLPEYKSTDTFDIGNSERIAMHAALCNITVFSEPLTKSQITQQYNLLYMQNPPVNNLL